MRKITAGLLGVVALATSLAVLRQPRPQVPDAGPRVKPAPAGESVPAVISLDRLRELGI